MVTLPLIDFSVFYNGTDAQRDELSKNVAYQLKNHGAMRLKNTRVSAEKVAECFDWGKKFFALPVKEKECIPNERNANPQRGWSYVGSENTSKLDMTENAGLEDMKEHFDHSSTADTEFPSKWPAESSIPGYRKFMEEYLEICHDVGFEVMSLLEQGLGLPKNALLSKCGKDPIIDELRLNYYAPISTEQLNTGKFMRAWPHTDFGMITLLFQDSAGGLEVQDRSKGDSFISIEREDPTEVNVYVSNSLEYMTNNYLRAGLHQVATPVSMRDIQQGVLPERQSIACFIKPLRHINVGPMKEFVTKKTPKMYKDLTGIQLHRLRVAKLYGAAVEAY